MNIKPFLSFLALVAVLVGAVFFTKESRQGSLLHLALPQAEPVAKESPNLPLIAQNPVVATVSASREVVQLVPLVNAPISLRTSGALQTFELAMDELYLRLPDGFQRVVTIPKATTPEAFTAAIEKARAEYGVEPELVLYPPGAPRNEFSRRIVTRDVVITADSQAEADKLADEGGLVFQKELDFAPGNYVYKAPTSLAALSMQLNAEAINLASVSTQLARKAATLAMPNDPFIQLQWHLKNTGQKLLEPGGGSLTAVPGIDINVESVWNYPESNSGNYTRGQGVVIGIVDDSLQWNHPDLKANVLRDLQWDWNQSDNDPSPYYWGDDHGTACAGVAAARGNNRLGVSGVAPEASLVGMRLISEPTTDLDEAEAMAWKSDQIDIKSNSWGYRSVVDGSIDDPDGEYYLRKNGELANAAIKHAIAHGRKGKGTIFTFAAGNDFEYSTIDFTDPDKPKILTDDSGARVEFADFQGSMYTIAVGAIDSSGSKSYYSQIGSALVVSAPSNGEMGIMTTDRTGYYGYNDIVSGSGGSDIRGSGDYSRTFGGTSSACPAVSGVIALMLQKNPDLGWRDVQEILIRSANNIFDGAGWETNGEDFTDDNGNGLHDDDEPFIDGNGNGRFDGIPFNYNYGAGMVDAEAAVEMADGWDNLAAQTHSKDAAASEHLNAGATIDLEFEIESLRAEHVTLKISTPGVKKGDLEIKLTSPSGMESVFCEEHDDKENEFDEWTFMSVRHWGEDSEGTWTLTIENTGPDNGTVEDIELIVYGTPLGGSQNPPPVVTAEVSTKRTFVGSTFTVTGAAIDQNEDASKGTIGKWEVILFNDDDSTSQSFSRTSSNGSEAWEITPNKAGNYTLTMNATDAEDAVGNSDPITIRIWDVPIAAWDFDTTDQSPVPLATAVQSVRKYAANFGSGNMTFDGSFDGNIVNSNKWEYALGQIFTANGTEENAVADMKLGLTNRALLLRGGKNKAAEDKSIVFEFSMAGRERLNVSYAADRTPLYFPLKDGDLDGIPDRILGGFTKHKWYYSLNGITWVPLQDVNPTPGFSALALNETAVLNNSTTAYLRIEFNGSTAASGQNLIDNIIISAEPIVPDNPETNFMDISPSKLDAKEKSKAVAANWAGSQNGAASTSQGNQAILSTELDWVAPEGGAYPMFVYAEVVDGAEFLNAPGSLLSAAKDNKILGLAEPLPQTTRYDLAISSPEARPAPLRVRLYDAIRQAVLVMDEPLEFESGATVGSPSMPVRYNVAYEEVEQRIPVVQGWNSFTTAVDPEPSKVSSILSNYSATEGDRLIGPSSEAVYRGGAWEPKDFDLVAGTAYSLLRQSATNSEIILLGKALKENKTSEAYFESDAPQKPAQQPKVTAAAPAVSAQSGHSGHGHTAHSSADDSKSTRKSLKKSKSSQKNKQGKNKQGKKSRTI